MSAFWTRKKRKGASEKKPPVPTHTKPARKSIARGSAVAMEVKLVCMEALDAGLSKQEVGELVGVSAGCIDGWHRKHRKEGVDGLRRSPSSTGVRQRCKTLEDRIVAHRQEHPEHGVRRIRDDLRRDEGLSVSAEKIRTTLNEAGLGNPAPPSKRRSPQIRRFERPIPNAMWQIDIFTFNLKRMYPVYLVGIIDDHSRYIAGIGLFRQQRAGSVLEVVKGAIGQWGAPREILSDNGRQFVAWKGKTRFQKVLRQQGIQHSRSAPHHPMTLGKIERFWQTIWREFLEEAVFASFADACQRIDHWVAYYNHKRPHQGIDGACPADRFYGLAEDLEEAVRQGCQENSERLALGQEPQPPLYLMGQLGNTNVLVTRQGEDLEVKLGDRVHEVIRLSSPYTIDGKANEQPGSENDEMEGPERGREVPDSGAGEDGEDADQGDLRDLWREPTDPAPGHGRGGPGSGGSLGTGPSGPQAPPHVGETGDGAVRGQCPFGEGTEALADEVRRGADDPGLGAQGSSGGGTGGRKKTPSSQAEEAEDPFCENPWPWWLAGGDGRDG